jgi:SAM-dependent methyltransferase
MANGKVWNALAEEYDNKYHAVMDWRLGYSVIEGLLGEIGGKRILDYGCGSGKFSRRLRDLGALVTAVDISTNAIERAKQKDRIGIDYRVVENDNLSFLESIGGAVAAFVFCTMQQESQVRNIAQQIYAKLNPGSYFVVLEPHPESLGYEYVSMKREKPLNVRNGTPIKVRLTGMETPFYDYWKSKEDYIRILNETGFKVDNIREPIVDNCPEETFWKDERIRPPLLIVRAKKAKFAI